MTLGDNFLKQFVPLVYLSFAFDSLLKINLGIKIHLGIVMILIFNFFHLLNYRSKKIIINKIDFWLIIFGIYILLSGLLKVGISSTFIFFYFFLALNVYFFIQKNFRFISRKVLLNFHYILIFTGLLQFILVIFFDYQLNFLDAEHYNKGSSVTQRLRGFFVEPNWFAIAFTFNIFLLVKNDIISFIKSNTMLAILTLMVLVLNGSFGTLAVVVCVYGYKYFKKNIVVGLMLLFLGGLGFYLGLQKRAEFKKGKSGIELFNYYSRTEPFKRVNAYFNETNSANRWFGEGLGSWGTLAVSNKLSVLNFEKRKSARDSSELHVFLFELGIIGTLIFFLDILVLFRKNQKENFYLRGALLLFVVSFLLYPIFKFLMYMIYYFVVRAIIKQNRAFSYE